MTFFRRGTHTWTGVVFTGQKYWWVIVLLILASIFVTVVLVLSSQRPPPELEILINPTPPILLESGDHINLMVTVHNTRGSHKAKDVRGNITFPEGFTPQVSEFYCGIISGGDGSGTGEYVSAPSQPGNYTASITVWGTNIDPQTEQFAVEVASS